MLVHPSPLSVLRCEGARPFAFVRCRLPSQAGCRGAGAAAAPDEQHAARRPCDVTICEGSNVLALAQRAGGRMRFAEPPEQVSMSVTR